jgi:uncharacterized RDD family membrane protein YckC
MTDVVTGEAVALELPVANFTSRIAALLLDMLLQVAALVVLVIVLVTASRSVTSDYNTAGLVTISVLVFVGYPTTFETLSRGKTLGKMALGIRVVGDDGSPERFRQALVRALVGVFEIWSFIFAPVGLITSIVSARGKRVGDVFAGTYVVQERAPARRPLPPAFAVVPPPLASWAQALQVDRLSNQTAEAAGGYLRRFAELSPTARDTLGIQLANAVAAEVSPLPPPGTPPAAYLSAVLAVRRAREHARMTALQPGAWQAAPRGWPPPATAQAPVTQLPASQPPANQPPASQPPASQPPASQQPSTQTAPAQPSGQRLVPPA